MFFIPQELHKIKGNQSLNQRMGNPERSEGSPALVTAVLGLHYLMVLINQPPYLQS